MRITLTLVGLLVAVAGLRAEAPAVSFEPVPGGLSSRLAPLRASLDAGKADFQGQLTSSLETSRKEAHELIDQIIDSGNLEAWLASMKKKDGESFAASLEGKDPELVRKALHSRLERRLAKLGGEITEGLAGQDEGKLKASFDQAVNHLAREEGNLMEAAANAGIETLGDQGRQDVPAEAPSAPKASVTIQNFYGFGQGGQRAVNASYQSGGLAAYNRTLQTATQRAWFSNQLAATQWNNQVNSFNRYLYGKSAPSYANPRLRRVGLPAGYYYRPDRVERVVQRGLWGAAAVAATPFALVASMF